MSISNSNKCPHCEHIYSLNYTDKGVVTVDACSHLLFKTQLTSRLNSPFTSVNSITVDLMGNQVPLVILLRFIKFIRERNGNNPQGYFTIHQSRSRISNTFQGVTVFRLTEQQPQLNNNNNINNNNNNNTNHNDSSSITEHTFYLTSNPNNDLSYFESFIIKNYVDIFCPIKLELLTNNNNQSNNQSNNIIYNNNNSNNNSNDNNNSNGNNNEECKDIVCANLNNQQLIDLLNSGIDDGDEQMNWDGTDMIRNGRFVIITGIPHQLPTFLWLPLDMANKADSYLLPITLHNSTTSATPKSQILLGPVQISSIITLPPIAIQS